MPRGVILALAIGAAIAGYTLVDKEGVEHASVISYFELVLAPVALVALGWHVVRLGSQRVRAEIGWPTLGASVFAFTAYALVLAALTLAPAPAVAAVRETSVLFAVVLGAVVLREPVGASARRRCGARGGRSRARRAGLKAVERCYSCSHHISPASRNGRVAPIFVERADDDDLRERTDAAGRDRTRGRVARARCRRARRRAPLAEPILRLRRSSRRRRSRALRARDARPRRRIAPSTRSTCRRPGWSARCASPSTSLP